MKTNLQNLTHTTSQPEKHLKIFERTGLLPASSKWLEQQPKAKPRNPTQSNSSFVPVRIARIGDGNIIRIGDGSHSRASYSCHTNSSRFHENRFGHRIDSIRHGFTERGEYVRAGRRCRPAVLLLHYGFRFDNCDGMKSLCPPNHSRQNTNSARAFTLTELVVVIATIAVLTALVLPALAGAANKGGRAQCANNLRQIYVASMMYATEYRNWLPIDQTHPQSVNVLNGMH